jgi:hypothetical protein
MVPSLKAVVKVSGAENFVGSLCRNLCRIGHFSTKASTKELRFFSVPGHVKKFLERKPASPDREFALLRSQRALALRFESEFWQRRLGSSRSGRLGHEREQTCGTGRECAERACGEGNWLEQTKGLP